MKKALSILLTLVMLLGIVFSLPVTVYAEEGDGTGEEIESSYDLGYEFVSENGRWRCMINGDDTIILLEYFDNEQWEEHIVVPSVLDGFTVTAINEVCFQDSTVYDPNGCVKNITIPKTVTSIGSPITWNTDSIENLYVEDGNEVYEIRGNAIVHKDSDTLVLGCMNTEITEDDNIKIIGDNAFVDCRYLEEFYIPETVVEIGENAFNGCTSLASVHIPESVTLIEDGAFTVCNGVETATVAEGNEYYDSRDNCNAIIRTADNTLLYGFNQTVIPESVTAIRNSAFNYIYDYNNGQLHEGITSIGESAFSQTGITELYIPESCEYIGPDAFTYCDSLSSIEVAPENSIYDSRDNCNAIICTAENKLISGCKNSFVPAGIVTIGDSAFEGILSLMRLTLPDSVARIEDNAFFNCNGLRRIVINNGECDIIDTPIEEGHIPPGEDDYAFGSNITNSTDSVKEGILIFGQEDSKVQKYAENYGRPFVTIGTPYNTYVYFVNTDWSEVTADVYFENSEDAVTDSGISVQQITDESYPYYDLYRLDFNDFFDYIEFNDGGENRTPHKVYAAGWYYNLADGEWYSSLDEIPNIDEGGDDWYDYEGAYLVIDYADESKTDCTEFKVDDPDLWDRYFDSTYDYELGDYVYVLKYELSAGDKIKAVYYDNENVTYYKGIEEDWYEVTDDDWCVITFDREGRLEDTYKYIHVEPYVIPEGYYLMGNINGQVYDYIDVYSEDDRLFYNNGDGIYYLNFWDDLYENDEIMVVYYDGANITNSFENLYIVSAEESGDSTIWFYSKGDAPGNHEYIYIEVYEPEVVEPGYYLVGYMGGDDFTFADQNVYDRTFKALDDGIYVLNRILCENDEIRVAYYNGTEITEYYDPDSYYTVPAHEAGDMNIFFDPNGGFDNDYKYLKIEPWEYICDHVDEDEVDNYCDICGEFIGKRLGEAIGYHMVLSDKLELFYHIQMSEEILADENAQVVFETPNGETKTYLVSQGVPDNEAEEDNVYIYSCEVAAKEMRSNIGATLVSGDETEVLDDYCVYYYLADIILSNYFDGYHTEEVSLVKALLNYGAASQMYFNYDTDKLANSIGYVEYETGEYIDVMTDEDKRLADVYLDDFKGSVTGSENGIEYYGSTISLESGTDIKHYFLIEKGTEIPVAKVYYKNGEMLGEYELESNGDLYQLKIAGVFGQDLDEMYKVEIGGMTIEYGAFSYGAKAMEQQGAQYDTMKNVVKALRAYNIEAEKYLETV